MKVVVLLSHLFYSRAELRYGVDSLSDHGGYLREAHVRVDIHLPANCFDFVGFELAKVISNAVELIGIFSVLNLCKNLISCLFSLGEFSCDLSKASIDFRVGGEVLNLFGRKFATKLHEKIVLILEANLSQEGAEVLKILIVDAGIDAGFSLDLGEV